MFYGLFYWATIAPPYWKLCVGFTRRKKPKNQTGTVRFKIREPIRAGRKRTNWLHNLQLDVSGSKVRSKQALPQPSSILSLPSGTASSPFPIFIFHRSFSFLPVISCCEGSCFLLLFLFSIVGVLFDYNNRPSYLMQIYSVTVY